jgi:hypothetical protein
LDLSEQCGVVSFSSFKSIIMSSGHVVTIGVLSFLSFVYLILSFEHVGELNFSTSLVVKLLANTN